MGQWHRKMLSFDDVIMAIFSYIVDFLCSTLITFPGKQIRYIRRRTQCKTGRPGIKGLSWWYFRPYCFFGIKCATKLTHWGWGVNYWSHPHKGMAWAWLNKYDTHSLMWCNDLSMISFQISCISNSCWSGVYFSTIMSHCTYSNSKAWNIQITRNDIYSNVAIAQIETIMGSTWGPPLSAPGGPHVGPINLAIRADMHDIAI